MTPPPHHTHQDERNPVPIDRVHQLERRISREYSRMSKTILITGGAGFICSHVADELISAGHKVRVLDNLSEQVHGSDKSRPNYLCREIDLRIGDVRDPEAVRSSLKGVDAVYHFAAMVGVGQS